MSALDIGLIFIGGFISGLIAAGAAVIRIGSKHMAAGKKKAAELAEQLKLEDTKYAAIEERMKRIKEIAQEQLSLQSATDGPQRNAMDGKYKNSCSRQIKQLEEEKVTILQSIIKDGFDPSVNVLKEDGTTETTKLSEFLAGYSSKLAEDKKNAPIKNVGKFVVHKGGRDDGGNTTTH